MNTKQQFEAAYHSLDKAEVVVLRNIPDYNPVYGRDIVSKYLTVIICHSGHARLLYDMQEVQFSANSIAVILPEHIMRPLESSPDYRVTFIMHSNAFEKDMTLHRMKHNKNKFHRQPACCLSEEEMNHYLKTVDLLEHISQTPLSRYPNKHEMLLALSDIMTDMLDVFRQGLDNEAPASTRNQIIFRDFSNLLAANYREQHEVAFYAEKAHLTTRHFSVVIKDVVGLSASDYIEQYLATQARSLLSSRPDLSVQQISDYLGFAESPSFCRFFKRQTGVTPNDFRNQTP